MNAAFVYFGLGLGVGDGVGSWVVPVLLVLSAVYLIVRGRGPWGYTLGLEVGLEVGDGAATVSIDGFGRRTPLMHWDRWLRFFGHFHKFKCDQMRKVLVN